MDLGAIQQALRTADIDGWLFFDFHHRDLMAYKILGLSTEGLTTRRWFYYVPAEGEPVKLAHKVEAGKLDSLPGEQRHYLPWTELHESLKSIVGSAKRVAMQYSPNNAIPYVSVADAGTVELIRSFGPEVVSSADLVQQFEAVVDEAGFQSHMETGEIVQGIKDEAFALLDKSLKQSGPITEHQVAQFILARFEEEGLTADGATPIVGFNDHPADPHFEPTEQNAHTLHHGDTVLIDLWARRKNPPGVYYDVTWCGFVGQDPPAQYLEIWDAVCRARDAALEFVRGKFERGETCHGYEVDDAARNVIREAGYADQFLHRTGHSIGTDDVHGNGVNIDNLETRDDRKLVPGICFSIEPGIYLAGQMAVRTEIDVFIKPDGSVEVCGPIQDDLILIG
jgi:Xaa-Pro aminopeptidase